MARLTVGQLIKELQECPNMDAEVQMGGEINLEGTVTFADDLVNITAHGLVAGDKVRLVESVTTTGTGLTNGDSYYVIASGLTANAFKISATEGGSAVAIATADYTAAGFVKESVSSLTDPSAASLPADAPEAAAVVPGVAILI